MKLISMENVQFNYGNETVLDNISLDVFSGEFITLSGPNGAAKSTLLKILLKLLKPKKGTVQISKQNKDGKKLVIGYVPQQIASFNAGFPSTVLELVQSGCYPRGKWFRPLTKRDHDIVKQSLLGVGMWDFRHKKIGELSGGQKQRICIARVLASEPDILVLDEPTTGMDFENRKSFYQLLKHHVTDHGRTVVMVTHDLEDAKQFADRNIYLEQKENTQWRCFTLASCNEHYWAAD
ncbi:metal ABC transporter ATP-binding protein [Bacillus sp. RG28]|uniref:Metal ABC transporter ATP-binding protein n=1 Tax=Gottfriedia endophytica TaxID=2820819 RepID=A0A940NTK1_9BACI|nr:metal ABC transporter ATP-binding protein [Gottfriedia endophytica]MBP0726832.1 metal ABC transporter ATP-binding protein [Gottfriedia endophytica]